MNKQAFEQGFWNTAKTYAPYVTGLTGVGMLVNKGKQAINDFKSNQKLQTGLGAASAIGGAASSLIGLSNMSQLDKINSRLDGLQQPAVQSPPQMPGRNKFVFQGEGPGLTG